ncbi:MAG: FkbM family methyltransferase [Proteobacteria bacterium]|nr:FkbM family methyltransferase [Pseudomonadota bacterium]
MRIFNKEVSIFDFFPYFFTRIYRRYLIKQPEWKNWQNPAVTVVLYFGPTLKTYSQFGEDIILSDIFKEKLNPGKFIDVGANHPKELNNTYRLYLSGWRGVNIEPGEKMHKLLNECRPEDTNLKVGLGKTSGKAIFYEMDVDSVSTFNLAEAENGQYHKNIISKNELDVLTLKQIYETYFKDSHCDLLSVDVEGNNFEVLEGNDWNSFRPTYIIIEMPGPERLDIIPFLFKKGYFLVFDNSLNGIFLDSGVGEVDKGPSNFAECLKPHART